DPIHLGHLILAEEARAALRLDRVVFIPARVSPLKREGTFFSAEERCHMVALAIADNAAFGLSRSDVEREGPSFTVDTLRVLQAEFGPAAELFFIMGMDSLATLRHWRQPEEIIRLARLVVISRPGYAPDLVALERDIPGISQATYLLPCLQIGISSTELRRRIQAGEPIRYQVPDSVEAYIRQAVGSTSAAQRGHGAGAL
ncbi:MAG: nicotinate-nucleotide adenylyltransferase, partial [Chloroflexota bacterium]